MADLILGPAEFLFDFLVDLAALQLVFQTLQDEIGRLFGVVEVCLLGRIFQWLAFAASRSVVETATVIPAGRLAGAGT